LRNNHIYFSLIDKYVLLTEEPPAIDEIYAFWTSKEASLGKLAIVAKQLLSAPATSASCERDFSIAGLFTDARRSNTSARLLNAKIIHATNRELIDKLDPLGV
jgi:hypothetical protein